MFQILNKILTGFKELDNVINLKKSDFVLVACTNSKIARTSLSFSIADNLIKQKKRVLLFSLMMTQKYIENKYKIDNLLIDDTVAISIEELEEKCRIMKKTYNIDLVIIDFLQLIQIKNSNSKNHTEEIEKICVKLKEIAEENNLTIICNTYISSKLAKKENYRSQLSDFIKSEVVQQIADVILFLHLDCLSDANTINTDAAKIIVVKNNNGKCDSIKLNYDITTFKFIEKDFRNEK